MRFWSREILGWLLLASGLGLLAACLVYVQSRQVVEAFIVAMVGIFVFRAGVHFLKVAVAARIYLATQDEAIRGARTAAVQRSARPNSIEREKPVNPPT